MDDSCKVDVGDARGEAEGVALREVVPEDATLLFGWRNLPQIVALSGSGRSVTLTEHTRWFEQRLSQKPLLMWIIEFEGIPIGQIRVDPARNGHFVTIYLLPGFTGRGYGMVALEQACSRTFRDAGVARIVAEIKAENEASLSFFRKAGFQLVPPFCGHIIRMELTREGQFHGSV